MRKKGFLKPTPLKMVVFSIIIMVSFAAAKYSPNFFSGCECPYTIYDITTAVFIGPVWLFWDNFGLSPNLSYSLFLITAVLYIYLIACVIVKIINFDPNVDKD